jgi:hypothetical protein
MTTFYCLKIRDYPNLESDVPIFISSRNRVAQLYPQSLGSHFVASYDSQGYGGGIRTLLHVGMSDSYRLMSSLHSVKTERIEKIVPRNLFDCFARQRVSFY